MPTRTRFQTILYGDPELVSLLAKATGRSESAVRHWRTGRYTPPAYLFRKIQECVKGNAGKSLRWGDVWPA